MLGLVGRHAKANQCMEISMNLHGQWLARTEIMLLREHFSISDILQNDLPLNVKRLKG